MTGRQFTIRDMISVTTGVAIVFLSEAGFSAFSRIIDTAPFELYPIVLPVLCFLHIAIAIYPVKGKDKRCEETVQANGCKWTLELFLFASVGFVITLVRRWELGEPMAGMVNCINLTNTAIWQSIAGVATIIALRIFCSRKLFLMAVSCISIIYWSLVLILHFAG